MKISDFKPKSKIMIIYAPPGGGKTGFALTGGPLVSVADFDDGLATGLTLKDRWTPERVQVEMTQFLDPEPTKAQAWAKFKTWVRDLQVKSKLPSGLPFKVLVIDSLTQMCEACLRFITGNSGKLGKDEVTNITQPEWGLLQLEVLEMVRLLKSLPCITIFLAHQEVKELDGTSSIDVGIPTQKLPPKLIALMDEVLFLQVRTVGGVTSRNILTKPTGAATIRSRSNLEPSIPVDKGLRYLLRQMGYDYPDPEGGK
jgi:hypothetical protein